MTDELVAYLLDDLCPERRAEVEQRLENDAAWRREYDRLKACLSAIGEPADGEATSGDHGELTDGQRACIEEEPPQDLVTRTCCFVTSVEERRAAAPPPGAAAFTAAPSCAGGFGSWSLTDITVGGGVLLLVGMLVVPALRESRDASRRIACQSNLGKLGVAMHKYQENHGNWAPPIAPGHSTGEVAIALADYVGVDRKELAQLLVCPDSQLADQISRGERVIVIPSQRDLSRKFGEDRARAIRDMAGSYATRAGYRDERGAYHFVKFNGKAEEPLMADAPEISLAGARSTNHAGGQYVLGQDLAAPFRANSDLAESLDNIFLNWNGVHDAGCAPNDVVLIRADRSLDGPFALIGGFGH